MSIKRCLVWLFLLLITSSIQEGASFSFENSNNAKEIATEIPESDKDVSSNSTDFYNTEVKENIYTVLDTPNLHVDVFYHEERNKLLFNISWDLNFDNETENFLYFLFTNMNNSSCDPQMIELNTSSLEYPALDSGLHCDIMPGESFNIKISRTHYVNVNEMLSSHDFTIPDVVGPLRKCELYTPKISNLKIQYMDDNNLNISWVFEEDDNKVNVNNLKELTLIITSSDVMYKVTADDDINIGYIIYSLDHVIRGINHTAHIQFMNFESCFITLNASFIVPSSNDIYVTFYEYDPPQLNVSWKWPEGYTIDNYRVVLRTLKSKIKDCPYKSQQKLVQGNVTTFTTADSQLVFDPQCKYNIQIMSQTDDTMYFNTTWAESVTSTNQYIHIFIALCLGFLVAILYCIYRFSFTLKKVWKKYQRNRVERDMHALSNLTPVTKQLLPTDAFKENKYYQPLEELDRTKIQLFHPPIDSGQFGVVYKAKLEEGNCYKFVAVKQLKDEARPEKSKQFLEELELFKNIGFHPHVVNMIGYCTKKLPYLLVMEYLPGGNLLSYLTNLRTEWEKRKNSDVFEYASERGSYITPDSPMTPNSVASSSAISFRILKPSVAETESSYLPSEDRSPFTPNDTVFKFDQPALDHRVLQNFALQIAKGMAYLESKDIVHRDLAARNILMDDKMTLKIADFGLSRRIANMQPYILSSKNCPLPVRWMAFESIEWGTYDTKSDVWSFGVVLWEIGSLGALPYHEAFPSNTYFTVSQICNFLKTNHKLPKPKICTDKLYSLMVSCWNLDPSQRPTFPELVASLSNPRNSMTYIPFTAISPNYKFPPTYP